MILFKKQLFELEVKGQGPTKVIMVHDTPPYGHAPTYQILLTYLERQNFLYWVVLKKIKIFFPIFINNERTIEPCNLRATQICHVLLHTTHRLMVMHPHTKYY
jgi:hypothetical protein